MNNDRKGCTENETENGTAMKYVPSPKSFIAPIEFSYIIFS